MESVKVLGLVNITVLAAGSIFTGSVHEPIKGTKNPQKMLQKMCIRDRTAVIPRNMLSCEYLLRQASQASLNRLVCRCPAVNRCV